MPTRRLSILIVEDEFLIASGISFCLEELGHQVLAIASSGQAAIDIVENQKPDLILMDVNLPEIDGITTMSIINQTNKIPCIYITGYSDSDLISRAQSSYTFGYLIKPVDKNDLRASIDTAISRFDDFSTLNDELTKMKRTLDERKTIERAKGIIMDLFNMKEPQALQYLQKKSRETNTKLYNVAKRIIDVDQNGK